MQSLASHHGPADEMWLPPMVRTIASNGQGVPELMAEIDRMQSWLSEAGRLAHRRRRYWRERIVEMMRVSLLREVRAHGFSAGELERYAEQVEQKTEDPYRLVARLVGERFAVMEESGRA